ncbi:MAG: hypothetical protein Tsb002_15130 [Wenzhouxiangellaceae bacterium]
MFKPINRQRTPLLGVLCLAAAFGVAQAQESFSGNLDQEPVVRGAKAVGGPVTGTPIDIDLSLLPALKPWQPGDPIKEIPRRHAGEGKPVTDTPSRLDPLAELQWLQGDRATRMASGVLNFEGNHSTANPNDPSGEVGRDYFIQGINGPGGTQITIYNKSDGSLATGAFSLDTLAPGGQCGNGLGDPIVLYDHLAERWFLSEFSSAGNRLCVYTSRTSNPITGGWCFYEFADSSFPDYPKYGVWPDAYIAGSNQGSTPPVYAFDRVNMLSPNGVSCPTARATQKITGAPDLPGLGFEIFTPVDLNGAPPPAGSPAYFIRHRDEEFHGDANPDPNTDRLELWTLDVDFNNSNNTTFSKLPDVIVSDFDTNLCPPVSVFSCVPQPNGGSRLDPLLEVVMNPASYRNFGTHETITGVLQTDVGDFQDHVGERWFELRNSGSGWALHQEGTYSPDSDHRFMGMVNMDQDGNMLLAYNVSSTSVFPSIRYTGRNASDTLNVMTLGETTLANGNGVNNSSRYGDYNHMSVDPVNDCTFWFLGMYNPNSSGDTKGVRIGAVEFDTCGGGSGGNIPPNAAFSFNCTGLSCSFNAGASSDSDGTITGYSWNFGDGSSGSGVTASHTYAGSGSFTVTLTVTDNGGASDTASQVVSVTAPPTGSCPAGSINFNSFATTAFSNQDGSGTVNIEDGGDTLALTGNRWRASTQTFNVTPNTVVEFDFSSNQQGEIHGIGFDEDNNISQNRTFRVYGTQNWGIAFSPQYNGSGNFQSYSIPVGQSYTGGSMRLIFVNDKDSNPQNAVSRFRCVRVFENTGGGDPSFFENTTNFTINSLQTVESPISVSRSGNAPSNLQVGVNIIHTYRGDLVIDLIAPDGTAYRLKNSNGSDSADNVIETYTVNASSETASGTWRLRVEDVFNGDTGFIDSWSLQF